MAIIKVGNVDVVVRTRDEHCPPHVHADCPAEGWSARFRFSYANDEVRFWDFTPDHPKREPGARRINEVGEAVYQSLERVRRRWWEVMGTTCLENQPVKKTPEGIEVVERRVGRPFDGSLPRVLAGVYDPAARTTTLELTDGSTVQMGL